MAELLIATRRAAWPAMPPAIHSDEATRAWVRMWDLVEDDLWVAVEDDALVGFLFATPTWLDHLYVDPGYAGQGVGSALVDVLKSLRPDGFGLWVFETNVAAQRFYAGRGLVVVQRTDGSENEEREPDLQMEWRPTSA